jgi:hypothetical protein
MEKMSQNVEQNNKNIIETNSIGPLQYERFYFNKEQIDTLQKLHFPLRDITENTLFTELHVKDLKSSLTEIRKAIHDIAQGQEGYTIGVSWIAPMLKRFGFAIEDLPEDVVKEFPAGVLVENQEKIAKEFIEKLERMDSRTAVQTDEGIINTLNDEEKIELQYMKDTLVGYEKISNKLERKIDFSDVKLAWVNNKDFNETP